MRSNNNGKSREGSNSGGITILLVDRCNKITVIDEEYIR